MSVCVCVAGVPSLLLGHKSFSLRFHIAVSVQYGIESSKQQLVAKVILTSLSPAEEIRPEFIVSSTLFHVGCCTCGKELDVSAACLY